MSHYNLEKVNNIDTDASDLVIAGVLIQNPGGTSNPVAVFSRNLNTAQMNYEVYNKEIYGITESFSEWYYYLVSTKFPILVYSDPKNLEFFATTKKVNRRHAL